MLELQETVDVWVFFQKNLIKPYTFFWHGRQIKIDRVNLIHTSRSGNSLFYHFSVSAQGNFYRLRLDVQKLSWMLEQVEEEISPDVP